MADKKDNRLKNVTSNDPRLRSADRRVQDIRQRSLQDRQITSEAQRLDQEFKQVSGSIDEIKQVFEKIPLNIRNRMNFDLSNLENQRQNSIKKFQDEIKRNEDRIKDLRERERRENRRENPNINTIDRLRADEDRYREENRILKDALNLVNKGNLVNDREVFNIARESGRNERQQRLGSFIQSQAKKDLATQLREGKGNVTSINYLTGQVVVDGQKVNLNPSEVKNLQLSSVTQAKVTKQRNEIIAKASNPDVRLTAKDIQEAQKLGIDTTELRNIEKANTQYAKVLKEISTATPQDLSKYSFRELTNRGLNNEQANFIIKQINEGVNLSTMKDLDTSKFFQKIQQAEKQGRPIPVDVSSQVQAYKIATNQIAKEFNLKPVDFKQDLSKFETLNKQITAKIKQREQFEATINKEVKKALELDLNQSVLNKAVTGQTMTPQELQLFSAIQISQGKEMNQKRLNAYLKWADSQRPDNYLRVLGRRYKDNPNLIIKDLNKTAKFTKGVAKELKNIGKELFDLAVSLVAGVAKLQQKTIESGINYFTPLTIMAIEGQGTKAKNQLKKDVVNVFSSVINKATDGGKKSLDIAKFIKDNPTETLSIITAAAVLGLGKGLVGTKNGVIFLTQKAKENPERAVAEIIFAFFPVNRVDKAISSITKLSTQALSRNIPANIKNKVLVNINKINPESYTTTYSISSNLKTGSYSVRMNTKGIDKSKNAFTSNLSLRFDPKTNNLVGKNRITRDGKTTTTNLNLVDKGKFFEDKRTGVRIAKDNLEPKNVRINIKEKKVSGLKQKEAKGFDGKIVFGKEEIKDITQFVKGGKVAEVLRESSAKFQKAFNKENLVIDFMKMEQTRNPVRTAYRIPPTQRTLKQDEYILKFLELSRFDKKRFKGLNQVERFQNLLFIKKEQAQKLVRDTNKIIEEGYYIQRTGRAKSTGTFEKLKPTKYAYSHSVAYKILDSIPNWQTQNIRSSKKGQVLLSKTKQETLSKVKLNRKTGQFDLPKSYSIPSLDGTFFIPTTSKALRGIKIPSKFFKTAKYFSFAKNLKFANITKTKQDKDIKQAQKEIKTLLQKPKAPKKIQKPKAPKKIQTPKTKQTQKKTQVSKAKSKTKPKTKKTPKKVKSPERPVIPKRIKKVKRIKPINLPDFKKNKRKVINQPLGEISYIITNPKTKKRDVVNVKTNLPFNEAKELGKQVVDHTLLASFQVKPYGKKQKRLSIEKVDLKKFTSRKGKDKKVRELVEKPKYRLDKKGETQEISQARLRAETLKKAKEIKAFLEKEMKKRK